MNLVAAQSLRSEVGLALWQWYVGHSSDGGWPSRQAFRPEDLPARFLPRLGVVDVEVEPSRVYFRIIGSAIAESVGRRHLQGYLDTLGLAQEEELAGLYRRAVAAEGPIFVAAVQPVGDEEVVFEGGALPFGAPDDPVRRFVIFEDYFGSAAWEPALRYRRYRSDEGR